MAERDPSARLRRAVKENNLFLVKRLTQRTDIRNIDSAPRRFTSLSWAAVLGHEETFEFLLTAGHDDDELSKDSENNTVLMLLAETKPPVHNSYASHTAPYEDVSGAALRMARLYYDRYHWILDWSNAQGKTALHIAALKGNEELVRMFCDFGADIDLADNEGNTPLHYASAWGHIPIVQLLIERGCQYSARNNEGFTASDYAYSFSTKDTLQDTARLMFEHNKRARRNAQAVERGGEWGPTDVLPPLPKSFPRMRSGSGNSRSTNAHSENGEAESNLLLGIPGRSSHSTSSSPPRPPTAPQQPNTYAQIPTSSTGSPLTHNSSLGPPINPVSALSPIANRMRERDADAMERYLLRNRSGSQGTSSTENRSQNGSSLYSSGPSGNADDITPLNQISHVGTSAPRRLRPSVSAAQLRTPTESVGGIHSNHAVQVEPEIRHRAGTGPTQRPVHTSLLARTTSISTSPRRGGGGGLEVSGSYVGPPSQYAQFPEPPEDGSGPSIAIRRKAFRIPKPLPSLDESIINHRRGLSATLRGAAS